MTHPIESLEIVLNMAKWRRDAGHKLVRVRRIDESDMGTLERIVEDYVDMMALLYKHVSEADKRLLDEKWQGFAPKVLERLLERNSGPQ